MNDSWSVLEWGRDGREKGEQGMRWEGEMYVVRTLGAEYTLLNSAVSTSLKLKTLALVAAQSALRALVPKVAREASVTT